MSLRLCTATNTSLRSAFSGPVPQFPESTRRSRGTRRNVLIIMEAVISKNGCVRSMSVVKQSPYPELNGAALMALSKWRFSPGSMNGQPVDVLLHLTI